MAAEDSCDAFAASCPLLDDMFNTNQLNEQWKDDATWILTSSFVILTMQSGFGLLEIGCSTPGNEVNTMLKNVADIIYGSLAFYFVGYGIAYGEPSTPFMGLSDFLPSESFLDATVDDGEEFTYDIDSGILYSRYLFQLSFAATAATIVSGCIAMRMRFAVYCTFSFFAVIVYSFVAHWVWADNGWLNMRGYHDFAGGSAVHLHGAVNGMIAIWFVGARTGRFDGSRPESDFAEGSPTSMLFGLFMLWWGWIGFNCGSTFGITDNKWLVAARAGVNTINASAGGGVVSMLYSKFISHGKYIRPRDVVNGILGALVSSTANCDVVHTYDSLVIGAVGGLLALFINDYVVLKWIKWDDPVGALGVHGGGGIWGGLAVALFADSKLVGADIEASGLFRGGGFELLGIQLLGIVSVIAWSLAAMPPFFYIVGVVYGGRWKNPRHGLRYNYLRMDPELHGASEDPTDLIRKEIDAALEKERERGRGDNDTGRMSSISTLHEDPIEYIGAVTSNNPSNMITAVIGKAIARESPRQNQEGGGVGFVPQNAFSSPSNDSTESDDFIDNPR